MELEIKKPPMVMPGYSLTGDLLSFLRCPLQYRYLNGSALPPSRPVQMWFGEFIHGVMEEAYRRFRHKEHCDKFPWNDSIIENICEGINKRLRAQGKCARNKSLEKSSIERAKKAINMLGEHLFPLIKEAEVRLRGSREMLPGSKLRAEMYIIEGVIDVVTNIELEKAKADNVLLKSIKEVIKPNKLEGSFEVLIDYKGMRRPPKSEDLYEQLEWQINTYAWLREKQDESDDVRAGILIFMNELHPSENDLVELKTDIIGQKTDIIPPKGSDDYNKIIHFKKGNHLPMLSKEFLLKRAIKVCDVSDNTIEESLKKFDETVKKIEISVNNEIQSGRIGGNWTPEYEKDTCAACDIKYKCKKSGCTGAPYAP